MTPPTRADVVVIGAGMSGLSAADQLRQRGHQVVVLEAGPSPGGLARAIKVGGEPIEAYYHHIFPQDVETHALLRRLGMSDRLEWHFGSMAVMHGGTVYPFDSPIDLLRFRPLGRMSRLRAGLAMAAQLVRRDSDTMDRSSAAAEASRWFGRDAYELLWEPLLTAKFGRDHHDKVAMAWLVARVRQRAGARRPGGDSLGYLRGSLGGLVEAYVRAIETSGISIQTSKRVSALVHAGDGWSIHVDGEGGPESLRAPVVIAAMAGPVLDRMVELPDAYRDRLRAIPYRGVVCVLLELDRQLSSYYWVNVTDRAGFGCVGIIEHTNLIDAERYGGRSVVYLAHYVDRDGPAWTADPDELIDAATPSLRALQPAFHRDWIKAVHVTRDAFAQPVPLVGGPMIDLPVETGLPGLFHASLAHIYPDDRGVSLALRLGTRAADHASAYFASVTG